MLTENTIVQQLSQAGHRITQPRLAVIRALLEDDSYASPSEIRERAKRYYPTIGLVTVYRTLDLLSELGFVRRIHAEDGCHSYATANNGHHHHLICRRCGAAIEFQGCDLSSFLARVSQQTGYTIEDHLLELVGVCSTCQ
ncbi:MAG: Fur family transcriptional regulator [Anaerolineae bacterium]|jgi:Fur family ferric uptake transcriptional regulator